MNMYILVISVFFISILNADNNITNALPSKTLTYNLPSPVDDSNKSNWNITNWNEKLTKENGYGAVGNTMMFMNDSPFLNKGLTNDTSQLTVDAYNNDDSMPAAAHGYTNEYRGKVLGASLNNNAYKPAANTNEDTLECFMARDLPFRYKCEFTGLVYGGDTIAGRTGNKINNMDGMSGKEALNICQEHCKEQVSCVEVSNGTTNLLEFMDEEFSFNSEKSFTSKHSKIDLDKNVEYITFELNVTEFTSEDENGEREEILDSKILVEISYVDRFNKRIYLIKDVWTRFMRGEERISVGNRLRELEIKVYSKDKDAVVKGTLTNVSISHQNGAKYICPALQDVSNKTSDKFGYQCPSGFKTNFDGFEICSEGVVSGDNSDGTFSNQQVCKNRCNVSKKCVLEFGSFDATIFEEIREGRLGRVRADGGFTSPEENLIHDDIDCTDARKSGKQVLNEVTFNAQSIPQQTVLNGSVIPNAKRPRVLRTESTNYEMGKREEWKDSSYETMLKNGTFSKSRIGLGGETNTHFAYNISLDNGADYGNITSTSKRKLVLKLKPAAQFYSNSITYRMYAIIRVDIEKWSNTINGREKIRDQLWYIKTSDSDTFIPFGRENNYATVTASDIGLGNILPTLSYNGSSVFEAKTFKSNQWLRSSLSQTAPSFKSLEFNPDDFWYEFNIMDDIGDIIYKLPGLVRSSATDNVGTVVNNYSGDFDGTGDGVAGYEIYAMFSKKNLSFNDLKKQIEQIDDSGKNQINDYSSKIYKSSSGKSFNKFISPDNIITDSNVEIYQYGSANKAVSY